MCSLILLLYCHLSMSFNQYSISQSLLCGVYPVPPYMWKENMFFIYLTGTFLCCTCLFLSCYYSKSQCSLVMSEHEPCGWARVLTGVTLSKCVQTSALKDWDQNTTLALVATSSEHFLIKHQTNPTGAPKQAQKAHQNHISPKS